MEKILLNQGEEIMDLLLKYFSNLNNQQLNQLKKLYPLYLEWNDKINIISRNDIHHLYERHVLHSLSIAKIMSFNSGAKILDVGTGGGFPGIPLAILFPDVKFHLIDSIGKKIKVVNAIIEELELKNASADHMRVQDVKQKFDFIVSRAVTNLPNFVNITRKALITTKADTSSGILYLKGGDFMNELDEIKLDYKIYALSEVFEELFFETKKLVHIYNKS